MRPPLRRTSPHAWRPLTGVELHWCATLLQACGIGVRGRPGDHDALERLEACLEAATRRLPWREAHTEAAPGMKPDSLRRCFRRWADRGVFKQMLRAMRLTGAPSPEFEWFACMAFRRAFRAHGREALRLPRETGFASALPAPPSWLPDPDLSASWHRRVIRPLARPLGEMCDGMIGLVRAMLTAGHRLHGGVLRVPRWAKAGW